MGKGWLALRARRWRAWRDGLRFAFADGVLGELACASRSLHAPRSGAAAGLQLLNFGAQLLDLLLLFLQRGHGQAQVAIEVDHVALGVHGGAVGLVVDEETEVARRLASAGGVAVGGEPGVLVMPPDRSMSFPTAD